MGRYDKIRCWNGSSWVQPTQMYVWNGSSWVDYGTNDSSNTKEMYAWNGSSWVRQTLNRTVTYGNKEWYCSGAGGWGTVGSGYSRYNLNQNQFHFHCYCMKDYGNDKRIATFGNTSQGWNITWLTDGRIQWSTYYSGGVTHSYTSNSVSATYTWVTIDVNFNSTGTGAGDLYLNGTWSSANRSRRHQYSGQTTYIGNWGVAFRDVVRIHGINSGGTSYDDYFYINNFAVKTGAQSNGILSLTDPNTVTQDSSVSWT